MILKSLRSRCIIAGLVILSLHDYFLMRQRFCICVVTWHKEACVDNRFFTQSYYLFYYFHAHVSVHTCSASLR